VPGLVKLVDRKGIEAADWISPPAANARRPPEEDEASTSSRPCVHHTSWRSQIRKRRQLAGRFRRLPGARGMKWRTTPLDAIKRRLGMPS